jgi:rod shape-determining protein MreD
MTLAARIVAVVAAVILQIAYFGHLRPIGVIPNLMLVLVIVSGLFSAATPTVATALFGGLLLDLASGSDFGLRMAFYLLAALVVIALRQFGVHPESLLNALILIVVLTAVFDLAIVSSIGPPNAPVLLIITKEAVVNAVIGLILLVGVALIQGRKRVTGEIGGIS